MLGKSMRSALLTAHGQGSESLLDIAIGDTFERRFMWRSRLNVASIALERQRSAMAAISSGDCTHPAVSPLLAQAFSAGCKFIAVTE